MKSQGGADRITYPYKERPKRAAFFLTTHKEEVWWPGEHTQGEGGHLQPKKKTHQKSCWHVALGLPASRENKCQSFKPHSLQYFVKAVPAN